MTPDDRIAQLEAENQRLRDQNFTLLARVLDLEAHLAKDSHNSSKPPSSDGLKVQQKVSGCFRSEWGAEAYATIRGYLATLCKQGQALLAALNTVFAGQPFYPASAWPGSTPVHTR